MSEYRELAYACRRQWDNKERLSLKLYKHPEDIPHDHRTCGIVELQVFFSKVTPSSGAEIKALTA